MFFYHYTPALPFLAIILSERLSWVEKIAKSRRWTTLFLITAGLWFVIFYPHLTGLAVSRTWAEPIYFLFPGWR